MGYKTGDWTDRLHCITVPYRQGRIKVADSQEVLKSYLL